MQEQLAVKRTSPAVLNRKPDAPSALLPATAPAEHAAPPIQARFGHDFSRLTANGQAQSPIQRAEEDEIQKKADPASPIQRAEEDEMQKKADGSAPVQRAGGEASGKSNQTGLPDNLKSGVENLSGQSLDDVNVHYNSSQPKQVGALAYAQGTDIHVASGQEQHLPHEAWHVAQQKQGRVQPTFQMKIGVGINDDQSLEKEADVMGTRALSASNQGREV